MVETGKFISWSRQVNLFYVNCPNWQKKGFNLTGRKTQVYFMVEKGKFISWSTSRQLNLFLGQDR